MDDAEKNIGDPLNPVMFRMLVGLEALDIALTERGMVACDLHRKLVVDSMRNHTWDFVEKCADEVADLMEMAN